MAARQMFPNPYAHSNNSDLPPGWEMLFDKNTGWPYFVDHNTRQTSWEDPRMRMNPGFYQPQPPFGAQNIREIPVVHESSKSHPGQMPQPPTSQPGYPPQQQPYQQGYPPQQYPPQNYPHAQQPQPWQNASYPQQRGDMATRSATPPRSNTPPRVGTPPRSGYPQQQQSSVVREIPIHHMTTGRGQGQGQSHPDMQGYTVYTGQPHQQAPQPQMPQPGYYQQPQQMPHQQPQQMPHQQPQQMPHQQPQQMPHQQPQQMPPQHYPQQPQAHPQPPQNTGPAERMIPIHHETTNSSQGQKPPFVQPPPPQPQYTGYGTQHPRQQVPRPDYPDDQPPPPPSAPQQDAGLETNQDTTDSKGGNHNGQNSSTEKEKPVEKHKPLTNLEMLESIMQEVKDLESKVNSFQGKKTDRDYKFLEEMLTRNLIKCDEIQAGSDDNIRHARKQTVRSIQASLDQLELKAFSEEQGSTTDPASDNNADTNTSSSNTENQKSSTEAVQPSSNSDSVPRSSDPTRVKEMVLDSEVQC